MSDFVIPAPPATLWERLRWAILDAMTIARRDLAHIRRVPEKLMDVTVQPAMFVLLFGYIFGSAINVPGGGNYREFLMAGIFTQAIAGTAMGTSVGVADDMAKGLIDRFRSLPMARSAVLTGRTFADLVEGLIGMTVLVSCGLLVGWRAHEGLTHTLAGFGLLILFGFAMSWVGTFMGLLARSAETAQAMAFIWFVPLTFVANTFVPTQGMPTVMRIVAEWNPISATTLACRKLFGNPGAVTMSTAWPLQHPIVASIGWSLLFVAVFMPLAVRRYRTATSR
jgi:ABC-2 type transport system permease protein